MTTLAKLEEAEDTRVSIYEYIKAHNNCIAPDMIKELNITKNQSIHHLKYLVGRGHVVKMIRRNATTRYAVYNLGNQPYSRKVKVNPVHVNDQPLELAPQAQAVARVVRLLDKHRPAPPKSKAKHYGSMQSGMAMFGNW
jgi:hypothetical protein